MSATDVFLTVVYVVEVVGVACVITWVTHGLIKYGLNGDDR